MSLPQTEEIQLIIKVNGKIDEDLEIDKVTYLAILRLLPEDEPY